MLNIIGVRRMKSSLWAPVVLHSNDTVMPRNADELLNLPASTTLMRGPELLLPGELPGKLTAQGVTNCIIGPGLGHRSPKKNIQNMCF